MTRIFNTIFVLLALTAIICCSEKTKADTAASRPSVQVISDEEVAAVGKAIEEEYQKKPEEIFVQFIDAAVMLDIIRNDPVTQNLPKANMQEIEKVFTSQDFIKLIQEKMLEQLGKNSILTYVGAKRTPDCVYAVMRLELGKGGINYWFVRCDENKELFLPVAGMTLNELGAKGMIDILRGMSGFGNRLTGDLKRANIIQQMFKLNQSGKPDESIALYETENCMSYKMFACDFLYMQAIQIKVTQNMDITLLEKLEKVIAAIKVYNPSYVGGDLFLLDAYIVNKQREKVSRCIANIKKIVGNDPYLDFLEGNCYIQEDLKKTLELYETAYENGLQSKIYLQSYYLLLNSMPNWSEKTKQKLLETGVQLYGQSFANELNL